MIRNAIAYHLEPLRGLAGSTAREQEMPQPGPDQVVIKVRAASLNRRDLMLMGGSYPLPATPDMIPLFDGVGEVIAVGDDVTRAALGDRVTASYFVHFISGPGLNGPADSRPGPDSDPLTAGKGHFPGGYQRLGIDRPLRIG
ncbi:alcohol dehydrogenase catalytic domain-containing protein [Nocardia rhamnosiphila]